MGTAIGLATALKAEGGKRKAETKTFRTRLRNGLPFPVSTLSAFLLDNETPWAHLPAETWHAKKTVALARGLLGRHLVRRWPDGRVEARLITEVEAYDGERDLACHAAKGRTRRTETLYAAGGVWYVYLCYGIHEMLNLVVGPPDWPAAVLIRGVAGLAGPGRLTKALAIGRELNGAVARPESGLWVEDRGVRVPPGGSAPRRGSASPMRGRSGLENGGVSFFGTRRRMVFGQRRDARPRT